MTTNALTFTGRKRVRRTFGRISEIAPMPNLIEVQKTSYDQFLQAHVRSEDRTESGLQEVFKSVFPIRDFSERSQLEFVRYEFEEPKYDVEECQQRGITYAAPLKVTLRLVVWDIEEETGARSIRDIKEQDVHMGDMPLMTANGTFVVNGTERVIVSQMHRSPGVFFDHDKGKTHSSGKYLFAARVIPYRGSWLDFEFDAKDLVHVRIDRRRKLPVTTLLLALDSEEGAQARAALIAAEKGVDEDAITGMTAEEILKYFYDTVSFKRTGKGWKTKFAPEAMRGVKLVADLVDAKTGKVVAEAGEKLTMRAATKLRDEGLKEYLVPEEELVGRYAAIDLIDEKTGEIYLEAGDELTQETIVELEGVTVKDLVTLAIDHVNVGPYIRNTLAADKNATRQEALMEIYRVMRPGEPPTTETAANLFKGLFFDRERYDLSAVGRVKMNARLSFEPADAPRVLRKPDILAIIKHLVELKDGHGEIDDIDHLGNRRVRSVGELMENQYRVGLLRMERAIRERMSTVEIDSVMPHDLINAKPVCGGGPRVLRLLAAEPVHGPDQSAQRDHPQAAPLGPGAGRPHTRARGLRGARRAPHPLRPHLPDRDARGAQYRPHQQPRDIRTRQSVRLHREPLPQGGERQGHRRGRVPLGHRGGALHHRPGQRGARCPQPAVVRPRELSQGRRFRDGAARGDRVHRCLPQAARFRGRGPHPLPRERRRQPRAHGIEHAAPGGAVDPRRGAYHRHRHGGDRGPRFGRCRGRAPGRRGRSGRCDPYRHPRDRRDRVRRLGRRHLQPAQVPTLESEHLHHPAPPGEGRGPAGGGRHHRRRPLDPARRAGIGPQRAGCLHAVARGTITRTRF